MVWVKALIICLYYFGMRISEALALRSCDFSVKAIEGVEYLRSSCPTLKNPNQARRDLYVKTDRPHIRELFYYVMQKDKPNERLWIYTRQWCRVKIHRLMPSVSPHVFRHSRLDGFAQAGETGFGLKAWAGWSSIKPSDSYVQSVSTRRMAMREK